MNANWFEWLTGMDKSVYCIGDRCLSVMEYCSKCNIDAEWSKDFDVEKLHNTGRKFDAVILWGVNIPVKNHLAEIVSNFLTKDGKLIMVYDNPLGVSMFNGFVPAGEKKFFATFNNENQKCSNTYYRKDEIEDVLNRENITGYKIYYPYPNSDYTETIYSDKHMPEKGELHIEEYPFETYRMKLFREQNLYDRLIEAGLFDKFSNSYIVVAGHSLPCADYVKFSNERRESLNIYTELINGSHVLKCASNEKSQKHISRLGQIYVGLQKSFEGTPLKANVCNKISDACVRFDFVRGKRLDVMLDEALEEQDETTFYKILDKYLEYIHKVYDSGNSEFMDIDLIFQNIIIDNGTWNVIDYEWTYDDKRYTAGFLIYRAIRYYYYQSPSCRNAFENINQLYEYCGILSDDMDTYDSLEYEFQESIVAEHRDTGYSDANVIKLSDMMMDIRIECKNKECADDNGFVTCQVPVINDNVAIETELPCACETLELCTPDTMIAVGDLCVQGWDGKNSTWVDTTGIKSVGMKTDDNIYLYPDTPFIMTLDFAVPVNRIRMSMKVITKQGEIITIMQKWQGEYLPRLDAAEHKVDELTQLCEERMTVIDEYRQIIDGYRQELNSVYNSRGWKMMEKMRGLKSVLTGKN